MRILVLQFLPVVRGRPLPRFDPALGTLLALLRERQHELTLLGLARPDVSAVKSALAKSLPQLIYADISAVCTDAARRTFQYIQEHEFLPVVAGGEFATADPAAVLSMPGVEAAALGEPDASLVTYLERIKDPAVGQVVQGVWLRNERGLARPQLPPLVEDLDSLPFPERELFQYADYVRRTGELEIAVGRGCPQRCGYCANPVVTGLHAGRGTWVRRRSPQNVLDEIAELRRRYAGARLVRFLDHAFALDLHWLVEFLAAYRAACDLPFRCHLRANAIGQLDLPALAAAGCTLADIEVISGSDFIRNEIFAMDLTHEQIVAAFERLKSAGVRRRAIVYLGCPYESEVSLADTHRLLQAITPDVVDARPYYPWPGTPAVQTCRENGWLHSRGEEQYHQDRCGIDMPACRPDVVATFLRRVRAEFPTALGQPWWRRWSSVSRSTLGALRPRKAAT